MPNGPLLSVGIGYSVTSPSVVIRPIWLASGSVNQSAPSGPVVIPMDLLEVNAGAGNSVTSPAIVIRAILSLALNQIAPSGPTAIALALLFAVGSGYSMMSPSGVSRLTWLVRSWVDHTL